MKISVVIPNYNGASLLKKNLPFVFEALEYYKKETEDEYEIIVTDDASTDASAAVISSLTIPIMFVARPKNGGFSSNVTSGVEHASGDILVLLNTDVRPEKHFLIPLVKHFDCKNVFAVGCMDRSREEDKEILRGRGVGKWEKGFLVHAAGDITKKNSLWASGGSSAFNKKIWDKIGGLYPIYDPFYWEDIDLSYRALKAGYEVVFEPQSVVVHEHESGSITGQFSKKKITTTAYRNQLIFIWINITDRTFMFSHILSMPMALLRAAIHGDKNFLTGFISAVLLLPRSLALRHRNKTLFRISDAAVLSTVIS